MNSSTSRRKRSFNASFSWYIHGESGGSPTQWRWRNPRRWGST